MIGWVHRTLARAQAELPGRKILAANHIAHHRATFPPFFIETRILPDDSTLVKGGG